MKKIIEKHSLAIRWFHWFNFPVLVVMIWSGLLIYWANDIYQIRIGDYTLFRFFPEKFYEALDIPYHLAEGMAFHFLFMWLFTVNGILYVGYLIFSGAWRRIIPGRNSLKEGWLVLLHDLRIRKTEPAKKIYNGAQKIIYTGTILLGIVMLISGLAIYKPVQLGLLADMMGGYRSARLIHFAGTMLFVLFFFIHIIQVVRAGWDNFRAMIAGFGVEELPDQNIEN